ncbi:MAG: wax ester/triacylglycerol synthase family O-acyltransferase [Pseudomonadales bacterium]|nr:wax ester/triacylglycerol synthase family O-acyltransferase [Pseudomonadales bacterium]
MEQLTGQDASFLYGETARSPMHIGGLAIYDPAGLEGGTQRFKNILTFIEERLHLAKTFRRKLVEVPFNLDHPYWIEDKEFDIEFHIRHIRLPEPGDWRQLCIQVSRLHSRSLDLTKPLWEFTVIEGLDEVPGLPKGSYAILTKIHHACIDGVSGVDITEAIHGLEPFPEPPPPPEKAWKGEAIPSPVELVTRANLNNMTQPFRFAEVMARAVPAMARFQKGLAQKKFSVNTKIPKTRFGGVITGHRVIDGRNFELVDVKKIKSMVEGGTVNDAILAIVGGALRKYLESKKELPSDTLVAMAPISVRGEEGKKALGNQVAAMTVKLGTDIEDPLERLQAVHDGASSSKEMTNAVGAKLMTDFSQFIPSTTAALATRLYSEYRLAENVNMGFNCVVTNVPGPQVPLYCAGARLVTQFGLGPIFDGMGLIFPVFSYCGQITITVNSCREMVPDPAFFAGCLKESFDELLAMANDAETS